MTKKEIESILKDYHWMLNSIKIMRDCLTSSKGLVSQYGEEASLPKQKGRTGDPVYNEVVRRTKYQDKIKEYEEKVKIIQDRLHVITNVRETEVLHWLLEGKSYTWIARHMGLSERHIRRIKDSIVEKMSQMPDLPIMPKMPNSPKNSVCDL